MNEVIDRPATESAVDSFSVFKQSVEAQFEKMKDMLLFEVGVEKNELWDLYLSSFPQGTNPIYRERTEHDCQCCKQFIRNMGNVIAFKNSKAVTIWDADLPEGSRYAPVAKALKRLVIERDIKDIFLHYQKGVGTDQNHEQLGNGHVKTWSHFYCELPSRVVINKSSLATKRGFARENMNVFRRSMKELTLESGEIVEELVAQGSLYRGEEHRETVRLFIEEKRVFDAIEDGLDDYCWRKAIELGARCRFRNTVIGTLLVDLSNGKDLTEAVNSFEAKVAPASYKRPKALVTKRMVDNAKQKIIELGLENSIQRRHAAIDDVSVNDVLFVDRSVRQGLDVFDNIGSETVNPNSFKKVQEVPIDKFMTEILPQATGLELLLEGRLERNLMSLTSQLNTDAPPLFKWDSGFSWSYNGEVADSIKDRVAKAGGDVTGVLRCSLSWFNFDDLDLHLKGPNGLHVWYSNPTNFGGRLDVDMNVSNPVRDAVENITWTDRSKIPEGKYQLYVNNYTKRERKDVGFDVELEFDGEIHSFGYQREVTGNVTVAQFEFSQNDGLRIINSLPSSMSSREIWSLNTAQWHKVNFAMLSPNHWNGKSEGNKHWFFILDQCRNPDSVRGFYNEFLKSELTEHRKVLEVLGSKMRAGYADSQLSGLGFSSTQSNHIFCRVKGAFDRVIKITF